MRCAILYSVGVEVTKDLFKAPDTEAIGRARRFMTDVAKLMEREPESLRCIRRILDGSQQLPLHSLTVGLLSLMLAREVISHDLDLLVQAGLAGWLHDISLTTSEVEDPEHCFEGHELLRRLGVSTAVCEAVLYHHERYDGSGFPHRLRGTQIPELARLVGIVNQFHRLYTAGQNDGDEAAQTFRALRTLAHDYRGCFDPIMGGGLVQLFAY